MIKAIVTDIEGTTSSLSFVKDVLFPYSRDRLAEFLHTHAAEPAVRAQLDEVRRLAGDDMDDPSIVAQLLRWIEEDRKVTPLKALQGMIWEEGYRQGHFKGHVYEDAARQLRSWHARGLRLYVYSSGSVQAQKLLFAHSDFGDLTPLFAGYFDTRIGGKRDAESYRRIAGDLALPPGEILFLSDIVEELDAARAAGLRTRQISRDGVAPAGDHGACRNFDAIAL